MAEISLRNYLKKVEQLLEQHAVDEAIAHCQRILEYYPRNVATYRLLAQALLEQSRWEEAGELLRRLLSALPNDAAAHQQMSLVYEKLKKYELSIWHLERAYDQQPNDTTIVNRLRELYAQYRNMKLERVQLTTGAVAVQYLNSGIYEQAIELLSKALARNPDRSDLRLLLARAQWSAGQIVDAAESAVEVLNTLPYTLAANRILTELWLREQRPSDAQRYLSRIEDIDPYLAFRLATGEAVAPETFMLPELDYTERVKRDLVSQNPDWLSSIADEGTADADEFELPSTEEEALDLGAEWELEDEAPAPQKVTGALSNLLPDTGSLGYQENSSDPIQDLPADVLASIERLRGVAADETHAAPMSKADLMQSLTKPTKPSEDDWLNDLADESASAPRVSTGLTGSLTGMLGLTLQSEASPLEEEDDSWLKDLDDFDPFAEPTPNAPAEEEDRVPTGLTGILGDLEETDVSEFDDQALMTDFELEAGPPLPVAAKPARASTGLTSEFGIDTDSLDFEALSWLGGQEETPAATPTKSALPASDAGDSMGWLQGIDVEFDPNAEANEFLTSLDQESDFEIQSGSAVQWMQTGGIELEDHAEFDELATGQIGEFVSSEDESLAWLKDAGADLEETPPAPRYTRDTQPVNMPEPPAPAEENADWLTDDSLLEEMFEIEQLTDPEAVFDFSEASDFADPATEDSVDWQSPMPENPPAWQPDSEPEDSDLDSLAWLSDSADDDLSLEEPLAEETDDSLGWLAGNDTPAAETPVENNLDWLTDEELAETSFDNAEDLPEDEGLGWLTDAELAETSVDAATDLPQSDNLGWLTDAELAETSVDAATDLPQSDNLGWLTDEELGDVDADSAPDFFAVESTEPVLGDVVAEEPALNWMESGFDADEEELEGDWASELDDINEPAAADLTATNEPEFTTEDDGFNWGTAETVATPAEAGWLQDLSADQLTSEETTDDEFEWGGEIESVSVDDGFAWEEALESAGEDNLDFVNADELDELTQEELDLLNEEGDLLADEPLAEEEGMAWMSASDSDGFDFETTDAELPTTGAETSVDWQNVVDVDEFDFEAGGAELGTDEELEPAGASWLGEMSLDDQPAALAEEEFGEEFDDEYGDEYVEPDALGNETVYTQDLDWMVEPDNELSDEEEWAEEDEFDDFAVETPTAGMTGLLNNIEATRYGTDELNAESEDAALASPPDWLTSVNLDEGEDEQSEEPAWLQDAGDIPAATPVTNFDWNPTDMEEPLDDEDLEMVDAADEEAGFEWGAEEFVAEDDAELIADEPDWLGDIKPAAEINDTEGDWSAVEDEPEWAASIPPLAAVASDQPLESAEFEDESAMTPAENAPDWLNAMVPGLEIDYNATEEDPEKVTPSVAKQRRAEFAWLNEIVEQELAGVTPSAPVPPPPPTPASQPRVAMPPSLPESLPAVRRFAFTRLPAWMRPASATTNTSSAAVTATVATTAAAATATLPPYLLQDETPLPNVDEDFNAEMSDDEFDDFDVEFDDDFEFDDDDELK